MIEAALLRKSKSSSVENWDLTRPEGSCTISSSAGTTFPLNLTDAVSKMVVLTSDEEFSTVIAALEPSSVGFWQREENFNKARFKIKWVQSTPESLRLGQKTVFGQ